VPTWTTIWNGVHDHDEPQISWDVPDEAGISGECFVTLDGRVWREELSAPPGGVVITVTVEPATGDQATELPVIDTPEATLTGEQRAAATTPPKEQP
jgi:hypothetical protein